MSANTKAVALVLSDVCDTARSIRRLCIMAIGESDREHADDMLAAARDLSAQLGWKADMAMQHLGDHECLGDAEAWMMSPAWHEATRSKKGAE